jgi:hypothetical protein
VGIAWSAGSRAGTTETLDLSPIINAFKFFRPLRTDRAFFATVHPISDGNAIAWGDDENIDLAATALERLAEETMTALDFREFLSQQKLTETALAAILGYSRRQIVSYANGERPIPRVVSLACIALRTRNPVAETSTLIDQAAPALG